MERRDTQKRIPTGRGARSGTVVDAKTSLSLWLRTGRTQKGMSLDDVARVTKIQPRILERLEAGKLEGLPADVFVRGFVRSFARCVGLDEDEALTRYGAAAANDTTKAAIPTAARAVVDAMADLAPLTASQGQAIDVIEMPDVFPESSAGDLVLPADPVVPPVEVAAVAVEAARVEAAPQVEAVEAVVVAPPADLDLTSTEPVPAKRKRARRTSTAPAAPRKSRKRKAVAVGTPSEPTPVVALAEAVEVAAAPVAEPAPPTLPAPSIEPIPESVVEEIDEAARFAALVIEPPVSAPADAAESPDTTASEPIPFEPAVGVTDAPAETTPFDVSDVVDGTRSGTWQPKMPPPATTASVPWMTRRPTQTTTVPSLVAVIDDADPDGAEHAFEERRHATKQTGRRTFLPPILLDREDRSARQGGLTLAVIILLIAATLTLSYLMRRPSSTAAGVTQSRAIPAELA